MRRRLFENCSRGTLYNRTVRMGMYSSRTKSPRFKMTVLGRYCELSEPLHYWTDASYAWGHFPCAYELIKANHANERLCCPSARHTPIRYSIVVRKLHVVFKSPHFGCVNFWQYIQNIPSWLHRTLEGDTQLPGCTLNNWKLKWLAYRHHVGWSCTKHGINCQF